MKSYLQVFKLLWALKRAEHSLNDSWVDLNSVQRQLATFGRCIKNFGLQAYSELSYLVIAQLHLGWTGRRLWYVHCSIFMTEVQFAFTEQCAHALQSLRYIFLQVWRVYGRTWGNATDWGMRWHTWWQACKLTSCLRWWRQPGQNLWRDSAPHKILMALYVFPRHLNYKSPLFNSILLIPLLPPTNAGDTRVLSVEIPVHGLQCHYGFVLVSNEVSRSPIFPNLPQHVSPVTLDVQRHICILDM